MKIYLLGMPGSGKSFWADKLSGILNIPAFDLDDEIERNESKTIAQIFSENGEDYFRQKESEILKAFAGKSNFILSTGGGAPCFHNNINWMNANGTTIWIDEPIKTIAGRLQQEKAHRPLIASVKDENLQEFLSQMRKKRLPFYAKAKHHVTGNISEKDFKKIITTHE